MVKAVNGCFSNLPTWSDFSALIGIRKEGSKHLSTMFSSNSPKTQTIRACGFSPARVEPSLSDHGH